MIEQSFPSVRPKPAPIHGFSGGKWFSLQEHAQANLRKISVEEYRRRDDVIRELTNSIKLQIGDTAYPHDEKGLAKYGQCIVVGISRSYKEFLPTEEWRKGDNPYVMSFKPSSEKNSIIMCTANYLVKDKPTFESATA